MIDWRVCKFFEYYEELKNDLSLINVDTMYCLMSWLKKLTIDKLSTSWNDLSNECAFATSQPFDLIYDCDFK